MHALVLSKLELGLIRRCGHRRHSQSFLKLAPARFRVADFFIHTFALRVAVRSHISFDSCSEAASFNSLRFLFRRVLSLLGFGRVNRSAESALGRFEVAH